MWREICSALPFAGEAGSRRLNELRSSGDGWLRCVYVCPDAMEANTEMEGLAAWFVDKAIKNCLKMMWRIRESVVGRLNVVAGQLIVSPGCGDNVADLLIRQESRSTQYNGCLIV